jgi:6-phosphogluconate dehydrogenase
MQLGMIGLGRMGGNMATRLMKGGHQCAVYDAQGSAVRDLVRQGAQGCASLKELVDQLPSPRALWLMLPAAIVEAVLTELVPMLAAGDIVVDGGNSYYHDDIRRAAELGRRGLHYLDVGVSGGVWGLERGYCLMIGGDRDAVARLDPIFRCLAPGHGTVARTPGRSGEPTTAEHGYLHCGPAGAGHFVKMVHNGIEYGLMGALAEGFNILRNANIGQRSHEVDAETAPLRHPEHYRYEIELADVAELWRRGSVVVSWLLDLTAAALCDSPELSGFAGAVSDSGEGRWTAQAAVEQGVPAPVISAALFTRLASRGNDDFANRLLSAMRYQFGGHREKSPSHGGRA